MGRRVAVVVFTRDLRLHDNPALHAALSSADEVVPLFVVDPALDAARRCPNRAAFLCGALTELDRGLRDRGGALFVRRGDPVREVMRTVAAAGAGSVHLARDWSRYARRRQEGLQRACGDARLELVLHPSHAVVEPGTVTPAGAEAYRVFSAYYRAWLKAGRRKPIPTPRRIPVPDGLPTGRLPAAPSSGTSPRLPEAGEGAARRALDRFLRVRVDDYGELRNRLDRPATSGLSPHLHFGCLSATHAATRGASLSRAEPWLRQLAWRDFCLQLLGAFPELRSAPLRPEGRWRRDPQALRAWKEGRTGLPLVDAAMRQLRSEGWMPNRARLVAASFLTRTLGIDWREGERHFMRWLVDGDVANNAANWQWVAGTGTDTRPGRAFNPVRQARLHDPLGRWVGTHVRELEGLGPPEVFEPWRCAARPEGYPPPLVRPGATSR